MMYVVMSLRFIFNFNPGGLQLLAKSFQSVTCKDWGYGLIFQITMIISAWLGQHEERPIFHWRPGEVFSCNKYLPLMSLLQNFSVLV